METPPIGLQLHASNRLEVLAEQLAERMRVEPSEALAPERVVVPHPTLGRWLRLALASELGIAANLRVELPAEFAWAAMRETVPTLAKAQPLGPPSLRWRIHERLRGWDGEDALARYLKADAGANNAAPKTAARAVGRRRYELADRLAQVYDRCMLYRPDWIRSWQRGETPHWQAQLWRQLAAEAAAPAHWVDAVDAYGKAVRDAIGRVVEQQRPEQLSLLAPPPRRARVSFFGIVVLSPTYLEMLRCAAALMDVHLYLLSPCREFWADTRSPRERPPAAAKRGDDHLDEGNPLLALWGRPARDMQALLADDLGAGAPAESYRDADASTRLGALQRDILELRDASAGSADAASLSDDGSLQIHSCHSAMREAEVLHDQLLGVLDAHPDIEPADVLILTPSLDDYAPAVESVFAAAGTVRVDVGRRRRRDNAAVKAFLDILALPGSRYACGAVLSPLRAHSVRRRFGIGDDLPTLRDALHDADIRWGIDSAHLASLGMPATASHTWREGARRLLLGYAVADDAAMIHGVVARPLRQRGFDASAADYEQLGGLLRYAEQLFARAEWHAQERSPSDWIEALRDAVDCFFADLPELAEVDAVTGLIDELEDEWRVADCRAPISFEALRAAVAGIGERATRSRARLADGATLGQLASGQIFPAKVVCVVGMNDRAFPRHPPAASFDLVAEDARRIGDRDLRDEDRFAFLEALLAARRAFIVTYTGRDIRDDTVLPPSVVVNDLTGYVAVSKTAHPLQPFSPRYFEDVKTTPRGAGGAGEAGGEGLFSYSPAMAAAANALVASRGASRRLSDPLPASEPGFLQGRSEAHLDELVRFAVEPVRFFFERRLGLMLRLGEDDAREEEPFALNDLEAWQLKNRLLALKQPDRPSPDAKAMAILLAEGRLQEGNLGRVEYLHRAFEVAEVQAALTPLGEHLRAPPLDVEVEVGEFTIVGSVAGYHAPSRELAMFRIGQLRPRDRIETWLRLLCVCCAVDAPVRATLVGLGKDVERAEMRAPGPADARQHLALWLAAWRRGWQAPLPLVPNTSWAWVKAKDEPLRAATAAWRGARYGDAVDSYNRLAFPDDPFGEDFESLAVSLLRPLLSATT